MKMTRYLVITLLIGMLTGCATTGGAISSGQSSPESTDDGAMKQKAEFGDLPIEVQQAITEGA